MISKHDIVFNVHINMHDECMWCCAEQLYRVLTDYDMILKVEIYDLHMDVFYFSSFEEKF